MKADETKTYWHFLTAEKKLRFGERVDVAVGATLKATGALALCDNGMHASERAIDAVRYAPGPVVCEVRLSGLILVGDDKVCARGRTVLWMADASTVLRDFTIWCGEWALTGEREAGREPDARSWAVIEVARAYLTGAATRDALKAAQQAAWAARDGQWRKYRAYAATAAAAAATAAASRSKAYEAFDRELTRRLLTLAPAEYQQAAS